jgi:hypothetical protein
MHIRTDGPQDLLWAVSVTFRSEKKPYQCNKNEGTANTRVLSWLTVLGFGYQWVASSVITARKQAFSWWEVALTIV